jgi:mono/diheme cytochrome c family protein
MRDKTKRTEKPMRPTLALAVMAAAALTLAACLPPAAPPAEGAQDFAALCAPCHGPTGVGDGPAAIGLEARPADLTGLSARNGGSFPMARVMTKIWGYARGETGSGVMPEFGPLLDSPTVMVDLGDGVMTPTPSRLIDIANYLTTIQK